MRPKKVILCVDCPDLELAVLSFVLSINHYRILAASTAQSAEQLFTESFVDLVLVASSSAGEGVETVRRLKQIRAHVPMILLASGLKGVAHPADAVLDQKTCMPAELLERAKIMSARKRGPRKKVRPALDVQSADRKLA